MKLLVKVNLVLVAVFAAGLLVTATLAHDSLKDNARQEITGHARLMMEAAMAARKYTVSEIRPLLQDRLANQFLPQMVPSYAATQTFKFLHDKPETADYSYKEATLNPTNPRDRATDWEADVVRYFRDHPDQKEVVGQRDTAMGPSLYIAKQIRIEDPACLACHSTPQAAPPSMVAVYGPDNGFGWQKDEIVGAQMVSVPVAVSLRRADEVYQTLMVSMSATFVALLVAVNLALYLMVLRPMRTMARVADEVSAGRSDAPEFKTRGNDEIAMLSTAFNRMRRSLEKAMAMLE